MSCQAQFMGTEPPLVPRHGKHAELWWVGRARLVISGEASRRCCMPRQVPPLGVVCMHRGHPEPSVMPAAVCGEACAGVET